MAITDSLANLVSKPRPSEELKPLPTVQDRKEWLWDKANVESFPDPVAALDPQEEVDTGWLSAVLDEEFWSEDIARNTKIAAKNMAANVVGFPSDMVGLMTMIRAADPRYGPTIKQKLGVDSVWDIMDAIPGNSNQLADLWGGDPDAWSMIATGVVAPGPGELAGVGKLVAAGFLPVGIRGMGSAGGEGLVRLADFYKLDKEAGGLPLFDKDAWQKTGWYKGTEGKVRFLINDDSMHMDIDALKSKMNFDATEPSTVSMKFGDFVQFDELYKMYPEIANMRLEISYMPGRDGKSFVFMDPSTSTNAGVETVENVVNKMRIYNIDDMDELRKTVKHEVTHIVQVLEGWATGTNVEKMTDLAMTEFVNLRTIQEAMQVVNDGASSIDEIYDGLLALGHTDSQIKRILKDGDFNRWLGASLDGDAIEANEIETIWNGAYRQFSNDLVHLLDYLGLHETDKASVLAEGLGESLRYEDMVRLKQRAYQHSAGEAEARLSEMMDSWVAPPDRPPNPADLPSVKSDLSIGQIQEPGIVAPSELADIPVASATMSSTVVTLDKPRIRSLQKKISKLEDLQQARAEDPYTELYRQATIVLEDPELRPLMSSDTVQDLQELFSKDKADVKAAVEYYQEMIDDVEDSLRFHLERDPTVPNEDIDDIIDGIKEI